MADQIAVARDLTLFVRPHSCTAELSGLSVKPYTKSPRHLQNGCKTWISICAQRTIETFSTKARIFGYLSHTLSSRNVTECAGNA